MTVGVARGVSDYAVAAIALGADAAAALSADLEGAEGGVVGDAGGAGPAIRHTRYATLAVGAADGSFTALSVGGADAAIR